MERLKRLLPNVALAVLFILVISFIIFAFRNPDLTQTQLFMAQYKKIIVTIILAIYVAINISKLDK